MGAIGDFEFEFHLVEIELNEIVASGPVGENPSVDASVHGLDVGRDAGC